MLNLICFISLTLVSLWFTNTDSCLITVIQPDYHVKFGHQILNWTLSSCNATCINNSSCIGFDWDRSNPGCFLFIDNLEDNATIMHGVDHYYIYNDEHLCLGNDKFEFWKPNVNKTLNGGVKEPSYAEDLGACVVSCLADVYCKGVDWNQSENGCWIIKNTVNGYLVDDEDIYHYDRPNIPDEPPTITTLKSQLVTLLLLQTTTHLETTTADLEPTTRPLPEQNTMDNLNASTGATPTTTKKTEKHLETDVSDGLQTSTTSSKIVRSTFQSVGQNRNIDDHSLDAASTETLGIKPTYVVIIGLGLGCIALTITAVVILCMYPLKRKNKNTFNTLLTEENTTAATDKYNQSKKDTKDTRQFASINFTKRFPTINSIKADFENPNFGNMEVVETEHKLDEVFAIEHQIST